MWKSERVYLLHALEAIDAVFELLTEDGRKGFSRTRKTQDAVILNIEIIGQAATVISDETRALEASGALAADRRHARQAHPRILRG